MRRLLVFVALVMLPVVTMASAAEAVAPYPVLTRRFAGPAHGSIPYRAGTGCAQIFVSPRATVDVTTGRDIALAIDACIATVDEQIYTGTGTFTIDSPRGVLTGTADVKFLLGFSAGINVRAVLTAQHGTAHLGRVKGTLDFDGVWNINLPENQQLTGTLTSGLFR